MRSATQIDVVVVSPGDVSTERTTVQSVIEGLQMWTGKRGFELKLRKWEDAPGGYYPGGIDEEIQKYLNIPKCDLVIGVFGKRYGQVDKPPYSRTAREILRAMEANLSNRGTPEVIVYVSSEAALIQSEEEQVQYAALQGFVEELKTKNVLLRPYETRQFNTALIRDLLEQLDRITGQQRSSSDLAWRVIATQPVIRSNGYSELLGELRLKVSGMVPPPDILLHVDITVVLSTVVSGRLDTQGFLDVTMRSDKRGALGRGKEPPSRTNVIRFEAIPLGVGGTSIEETLTISGIRGDGTGAVIGGSIRALIEVVTDEPGFPRTTLLREEMGIASAQEPMKFTANRCGTRAVENDQSRQEVRSFEVHFEAEFPGAFKTKEQEGGSGASPADHGTVVLVMLSGIPAGFAVFATVNEIRSGDQEPVATAVLIDSCGLPIGKSPRTSALSWERAAMTQVQSGAVAWEIVSPNISLACPRLTFRLDLVGPQSTSFTINVAGCMSPFYDPLERYRGSSTLPIPRFLRIAPPVALTFDLPEET